jgi:hypothetical protein
MNREHNNYLASAFKNIDKSVDELFGMKDEKKGFWVFTSHKYTADEIFKSKPYERILSIIKKIADDVTNWQNNRKLDFMTKSVYNVNRDLLEERIKKLEEQVRTREPTWWEDVKQFFIKVVNLICTILPRLTFKALANAANGKGFIGKAARRLLTATQKAQRRLITKDKIFISESD